MIKPVSKTLTFPLAANRPRLIHTDCLDSRPRPKSSIWFFDTFFLRPSINCDRTRSTEELILFLWQHPCSREAQRGCCPSCPGLTPPCQGPTGNNYRSGLHPCDSPWHSTAVWTLGSDEDCQGLRRRNVFQISSCVIGVEERRPESRGKVVC